MPFQQAIEILDEILSGGDEDEESEAEHEDNEHHYIPEVCNVGPNPPPPLSICTRIFKRSKITLSNMTIIQGSVIKYCAVVLA